MFIAEWQSKLDSIYKNKEMCPDYIMVHLSTKCSELGRIFHHNKAHFMATDPYVLKAISWLIAMCNHFNIKYEEVLINRFPGKCSYCLRAPCECLETKKTAKDLRTGRILTQEEVETELMYSRGAYFNAGKRISFDVFKKTIFSIYPTNKAFIYANYWAHPLGKLDEEKGELHKAYSAYLLGKGTLNDIAIEIADVTAWLISFWDFQQTNKSIDAELSNYFRAGCPMCKMAECSCPRYSISKGEEELLREIMTNIRTLKLAGIGDPKIIDEAEELLRQAKDAATPSVRDRLLGTLMSISKLIKTAPEFTGSVVKSAENIEEATNALGQLFK